MEKKKRFLTRRLNKDKFVYVYPLFFYGVPSLHISLSNVLREIHFCTISDQLTSFNSSSVKE